MKCAKTNWRRIVTVGQSDVIASALWLAGMMSTCGLVQAETINVPGDYPTIQSAIDAAQDKDVIEVDPGTYFENLEVPGKSVSLIGLGGAEGTILDGGANGSVLRAVEGKGFSLSLAGCTIQNGTGTDLGDGATSGGGILIDGNDLALSNCHVVGNNAKYGGGVYLMYGTLSLTACTFVNNTALMQGGGVCTHHADMYVAQSAFTANTCTENIGGAIACALHNADKSLVVSDCTFDGNWAKEAGGAIEVHADGTVVSIVNCIFTANISSNGGAISSHEAPFSCSGSTFESNRATVETTAQSGDGGAMWLQDTAIVDLANNSFLLSEAVSGGALMLNGVGQTTVQGCAFADNMVSHSNPNSGGGASHSIGCSPLYMNCTFSNNASPNNGNIGTALYVWDGTLALEGCDFCGHAGEAIGTYDNGNWWADDATSFEDVCCPDCNANGFCDADDISGGVSSDCNYNGVPDECPGEGPFDEAQWSEVSGGSFVDALNWCGGDVPQADSDVAFMLPAAYDVICPDGIEIASMAVGDGEVHLLIDGTMKVAGTILVESGTTQPSLWIEAQTGDTAQLESSAVEIAQAPGSEGTMVVTGSNTLLNVNAFVPGNVRVGTGGNGMLQILDGATVKTTYVALGQYQSTAVGALDVLGSESALRIGAGTMVIDSGSTATVLNGGTIVGGSSAIIDVRRGGQLVANGIIKGTIKNLGVVKAVAGMALTVDGQFQQPFDLGESFCGTLAVQVDGSSMADWSSINCQIASLGGLLAISADPAAPPEVGTQWPVLTAGYLMGQFDVVIANGLPEDMYIDLHYPGEARGGNGFEVVVEFSELDDPLNFGDPVEVDLDAEPSALLTQDLDGDGDDDLVIAFPREDGDGQLHIYENQDGNLVRVHELDVGVSPTALAAGHLISHSTLTLACAHKIEDGLVTIIHDPLGVLPEVDILYTTGSYPSGLAVGDFFGTETLDTLAVGCEDPETVEFWRLAGGLLDLPLSPQSIVDLPAGGRPGGIDPGQVNEDKDHVPLAVPLVDLDSVLTIINDGSDEFTVASSIQVGGGPTQARFADFDNSGGPLQDLVSVNGFDGTVSVLLATYDDDFEQWAYLPAANLDVGSQPKSLNVVDLDDDGDMDLVLVSLGSESGEPHVLVLRNDFMQTGQLVFAPGEPMDLAGAIPVLIGAGDLDSDAYPDLIAINAAGSNLVGSSTPSLMTAMNATHDEDPEHCVGDTDDNGAVDIDDLLAVIGTFDDLCPEGCDTDVNEDGVVDIDDLLLVIANFGPCPS